MDRYISAALRAMLAGCALALATGCAGPTSPDWNRVSLRDQHTHLPSMLRDTMRPAAVVTAGPDGLVVAAPTAPGTRMVTADGQLRLVSEETFARLQQPGSTGAMGAPAAPTPAR
jgi:hypothetical protein